MSATPGIATGRQSGRTRAILERALQSDSPHIYVVMGSQSMVRYAIHLILDVIKPNGWLAHRSQDNFEHAPTGKKLYLFANYFPERMQEPRSIFFDHSVPNPQGITYKAEQSYPITISESEIASTRDSGEELLDKMERAVAERTKRGSTTVLATNLCNCGHARHVGVCGYPTSFQTSPGEARITSTCQCRVVPKILAFSWSKKVEGGQEYKVTLDTGEIHHVVLTQAEINIATKDLLTAKLEKS